MHFFVNRAFGLGLQPVAVDMLLLKNSNGSEVEVILISKIGPFTFSGDDDPCLFSASIRETSQHL